MIDDSDWNHRGHAHTTGYILALVDAVRSELGLRRSLRLLISDERIMPMTWGWRRPMVLLPADAMEWDMERLRIVLRHELAHVKRWDCLTQSVANLVRAFYWFNPLVWLAARQMCLERERACDDLVLSAGARPSEYAGHLLEIARQFACASRAEAIAMRARINRTAEGELGNPCAMLVSDISQKLIFCRRVSPPERDARDIFPRACAE